MTLPRTLITIVLASFVGLAGCLGGDESAPTAETKDASSDPRPAAARAPEEAAPAASDTEGSEAQALVAKDVAYTFDGHLGTFATVCDANIPNGCAGQAVVPGERWFRLPIEGDVLSIDALVAWDAETVATEELALVLSYGRSCGADCIEAVGAVSARGASPLSLSLTDLRAEDVGIAYLHVYLPSPDLPVRAYASVDQAFAASGTVHTLVAP